VNLQIAPRHSQEDQAWQDVPDYSSQEIELASKAAGPGIAAGGPAECKVLPGQPDRRVNDDVGIGLAARDCSLQDLAEGTDGTGSGQRGGAQRPCGKREQDIVNKHTPATASACPASSPASSTARRVRHSHFAWWPGSCQYPGGSASASSSRYRCSRAGVVPAAQIACRNAR
jgi:hypothetical protein